MRRLYSQPPGAAHGRGTRRARKRHNPFLASSIPPRVLQAGVLEERDAHPAGEHDDRPRGGDRSAARVTTRDRRPRVNHPAYWREKTREHASIAQSATSEGTPTRSSSRDPSAFHQTAARRPRAPAPGGDLVNSIRLASGRRCTAQRDDNCGYPEAGARVRHVGWSEKGRGYGEVMRGLWGRTEEDLATRAGTTVERLAELIAIGIIRPGRAEANRSAKAMPYGCSWSSISPIPASRPPASPPRSSEVLCRCRSSTTCRVRASRRADPHRSLR